MSTTEENYDCMVRFIRSADAEYARYGKPPMPYVGFEKGEEPHIDGDQEAFEDNGFRRAHSCRVGEIWIRQHGNGHKCHGCGRILNWAYADHPERETLVLRCRPEQEAAMREVLHVL